MIFRNGNGEIINIVKNDFTNDLEYISKIKSIVLGTKNESVSETSFIDGLIARIIHHGSGSSRGGGRPHNSHRGSNTPHSSKSKD